MAGLSSTKKLLESAEILQDSWNINGPIEDTVDGQQEKLTSKEEPSTVTHYHHYFLSIILNKSRSSKISARLFHLHHMDGLYGKTQSEIEFMLKTIRLFSQYGVWTGQSTGKHQES